MLAVIHVVCGGWLFDARSSKTMNEVVLTPTCTHPVSYFQPWHCYHCQYHICGHNPVLHLGFCSMGEGGGGGELELRYNEGGNLYSIA